MNLFDYAEAERLRDVGIAIVSSYPNDSWVQQARSLAVMIAAKKGEVTINDVLKVCPKPDNVHPNASGAVMKTKQLKLVGYVRSDKITSHARRIGIYELSK